MVGIFCAHIQYIAYFPHFLGTVSSDLFSRCIMLTWCSYLCFKNVINYTVCIFRSMLLSWLNILSDAVHVCDLSPRCRDTSFFLCFWSSGFFYIPVSFFGLEYKICLEYIIPNFPSSSLYYSECASSSL